MEGRHSTCAWTPCYEGSSATAIGSGVCRPVPLRTKRSPETRRVTHASLQFARVGEGHSRPGGRSLLSSSFKALLQGVRVKPQGHSQERPPAPGLQSSLWPGRVSVLNVATSRTSQKALHSRIRAPEPPLFGPRQCIRAQSPSGLPVQEALEGLLSRRFLERGALGWAALGRPQIPSSVMSRTQEKCTPSQHDPQRDCDQTAHACLPGASTTTSRETEEDSRFHSARLPAAWHSAFQRRATAAEGLFFRLQKSPGRTASTWVYLIIAGAAGDTEA